MTCVGVVDLRTMNGIDGGLNSLSAVLSSFKDSRYDVFFNYCGTAICEVFSFQMKITLSEDGSAIGAALAAAAACRLEQARKSHTHA